MLDRTVMLAQMRRAHLRGSLQFSPALESTGTLYGAVRRIMLRNGVAAISAASSGIGSSSGRGDGRGAGSVQEEKGQREDEQLVGEFMQRAAMQHVAAARSSADSIAHIQLQASLAQSFNAEIAATPVYRDTARLAFRHDGYAEWQWPFLLNR